MELAQYVVLGFAPGAFWLWFLRHKDDLEPEPKLLVLRVFALGCLATVPVLWLRPGLEDLLPLAAQARAAADAFLLTAPLEEVCKTLAFVLGAYWHKELDEPLDGVIYGTAAGLGFASVENVFYLLHFEDPWIVLLRGFTSTPAHVATTGALGFFWGFARFTGWSRKPWLWLFGLSMAILFHGAYDYFLFRGGLAWVSLLCVLPLMIVLLGLKIRWARARSHDYHPVRARRRSPPPA